MAVTPWTSKPGLGTTDLARYWIAPWLVSDRVPDAWGEGWRQHVLREHLSAMYIIRDFPPGPMTHPGRACEPFMSTVKR